MPLDFRNTNSLWSSVLAETLHRCGVRHAVVSPGSRSAPLIFALAAHPGIETTPILDERSAAFFALGIAKHTNRPVALACTSGTAAANYLPAIIEAQESGVPLVVITADRPPEMRECSSGQTIDQQKLYGSHVNWYHEFAPPAPALSLLRYLRQTIAHACHRAVAPAPGPVHLNTPFRDPLPPIPDNTAKPLRKKITKTFFAHLPDLARASSPCQSSTDFQPVSLNSAGDSPVSPSDTNDSPVPPSPCATSPRAPGRSAPPIRKPKTLIIAGPHSQSSDATLLAAQTGCPLLADALSSARHTGLPENVVRVTAYDAILRNARITRSLAPDRVLCIGGFPTSKVLRAWLEKTQPEVLMLSPTPATKNPDPLHLRTSWLADGTRTLPVDGDPAAAPIQNPKSKIENSPAPLHLRATTLHSASLPCECGTGNPACVISSPRAAPPRSTGRTAPLWDLGFCDLGFASTRSARSPYASAWRRAETAARSSLDAALASIADTDLFEPRAAWLLAQHLPARTPVVLANSMPVRDAEYFWPPTNRAHRPCFNRGANGIDGTLSTALGIAHAAARPAVLLAGDLSLLHDTNGFLLSSKLRGSLTIVLINNNGGGIFEHLPVAQFDPPFEDYIATPQDIDFAKLCATYAVPHTLVETWPQFTKLISTLPATGVRVLEIRTDRKRDTARRKTLLARASSQSLRAVAG